MSNKGRGNQTSTRVNANDPNKPEIRFAKICWNNNDWRKPSGYYGKSRDPESYERQNGFGHEEWLFDFDKLVDGYHYAALQPIGKFRDTYIGNVFNISTYSVNSATKQWCWVAEIMNVEVIDRTVEREAIKVYRQNGWIEEMERDLRLVDAKHLDFKGVIKKYGLFNVRFKPGDVVKWAEPILFGPHEKISHTRYTLLTESSVSSERKAFLASLTEKAAPSLSFTGKTKKERNQGKREPGQQTTIQCLQLHTDIQNSLLQYLTRNNRSANKIELEVAKSDGGGSVDLVMETADGKNIFYEVKTYAAAKMCIREAIGQLLEYAYYPDHVLADELVVVSQAPLSEEGEQYIKFLKMKFDLPISYMQFDYLSGQPFAHYR